MCIILQIDSLCNRNIRRVIAQVPKDGPIAARRSTFRAVHGGDSPRVCIACSAACSASKAMWDIC